MKSYIRKLFALLLCLCVISTLFILPSGATEGTTPPTDGVTQPPESTTQPTEAVTEPTTQPTEAATEPTEAPTQPTEAPTQPTEATTPATEAPTQPTEGTSQPPQNPVQPPVQDDTQSDSDDSGLAQNISARSTLTEAIGINVGGLFDGNIYGGYRSKDHVSITAAHEAGIGSLYFIFELPYGEYTLTNNDTGAVHTCGTQGFMHEFVDVEAIFGTTPSSITLTFDNGPVTINELYIYGPGPVPETVQKWEAAVENATDMILFSTHGDDEQLFFAGLLPYYAAELDYEVLVVYLTDHQNQYGTRRMREMLAGLWAVGVKTYPVFGYFEDFKTMTKHDTYKTFEALGHSKEELTGFVVEQIRRFKPKVVIGHDFAGEYSHGQHMVYAEVLAESLEITNDSTAYPELAEKYGLWDVPKAYFHLYEENPIVMDWDQPLEYFDGLTAFQVTQKYGFPCHKSQHRSWFYLWIYGDYGERTKASEIDEYSPCEYGLYRSTVGADVQKNDFFENVTTYEQDRIAEEERLAEEARLKAEEEARLKAEEEARLKAEEEARIAQEQAEAEAAAKAQAEKEAQEIAAAQARQKQQMTLLIGAAAVVFVLLIVILVLCKRKKKAK